MLARLRAWGPVNLLGESDLSKERKKNPLASSSRN